MSMQLFFYLSGLFLLLTAFVSNENFEIYEPFAIFLIIFTFSILFLIRDQHSKIQITTINISFGLFALLNIVLLFDSYNFNDSLVQVLFYIQCFFLFIFFQQISSERIIDFLSKTLVVLTTIFGIFSFTRYIEIGLTFAPRLSGIVGPAGVYGGFLIIPFFLSIYLLLNEKKTWEKRLWYLSTIVIFTSLFLTFAYDAWISIIVILLFVAFLYRKKIAITNFKIFIKPVLIILALSFVLFCSIWSLARQTTIGRGYVESSQVKDYQSQNYEGPFVQIRFQKFMNGFNMFLSSPITGFGANSYPDLASVYNIYPEEGGKADLYNWFLRILVENGIVATVLFTIFIVTFLVKIHDYLYRSENTNKLLFILYIGLITSTFHGLLNADWSIQSVFLVYIVFAGLLYGQVISKRISDIDTKFFSNWFLYAMLVLSIFCLIVSIQLLRANRAILVGDFYYNTKNYDIALNSYFQSLTYNSYDDVAWYKTFKVYFAMNRFELAKNSINRAIKLKKYNGIYWASLALCNQSLDEMVEYEENMKKAKRYLSP